MNAKIVFPQNGLEELDTILGFRTNAHRDVVLISLDFEVKRDFPNKNMWNAITEVGASMLDTRNLSDPRSIHLRTRHFTVGGQRRFTISVANSTLDCRSIWLARSMRGVRFEEVKRVVGIPDTTYIARDLPGVNFRLEALLNLLLCPSKNTHLAGNDANYALRAPLILAYYGLRSCYPSPNVVLTLESFKILGQEPRPDTTQRNAHFRTPKPRSEYFDIDRVDEEGIFAILN
ncbi:hypothetical protein BKA64DRAFT_709626 [Cadophora sp. MPI-SDFR-AT-0126]|nr:hypothetical protein BKA64DRAFT_709626 [Leotiomycetes sp. MPI-SDFR-AT-0126]